MASSDEAERASRAGDDETKQPTQTARTTAPRPVSIISSRMTDIASEDGKDHPTSPSKATSRAKSGGDLTSRPGTARTGSSKATGRSQPRNFRRQYASGLSAQRGSLNSSNVGATGPAPSRTHVPSLTSNAFFRPMSSQRLQAQRAGSRPVTMTKPIRTENLDDNTTDFGGSVRRDSLTSAPIAQIQRNTGANEDGERAPPSRGTEMTEQETLDRITANTSPTHGHYPNGSTSDSVRPLHRKSDNRSHLRVDVDKSYKGANIPSPIKSPRSFRSSFLLPGKSEQGQNRSTDGAEKLSSNASSPNLPAAIRHNHSGERNRSPQSNKSPGRVYQYFDGNTVFCFGGRWQNSKQKPINIATGIFVATPCVLFFIFEAPWLWKNISPAIPITVAYLTYICISSFIHASVSDPGILPRNLHQFPPVDENEDPLRIGPSTVDWTQIKSTDASAAALEFPMKHCRTCNIWRPPRAHHCRMCDNCIEGHDHHCVWLNNCVGKRNYRYFFTFVTSATLLAVYIITTSFIQVFVYKSRENVSFTSAVAHFRVPFALIIIGFLAFCYPAALMGYHIFLMARGETTREYINSHKFAKSERFRPFSQRSIFRNLVAVLCRPRPPTYYRFKTHHETGDQRLGSTRRGQRPRASSQGLEMQDVAPAESGFQGPVSLRGESQA
ncbi:DHHC palmitoyltransferase domain-containing protein [Sarocladium implicatum]|nr:DHHC palmitoyltransferase domain-containing protein [Sarocladium implicatum]